MFRKKSLDKLHEPESLDQLLVVVTPRSVWTLASLVGVLIVVIAWGLLSRIPVTVDGFGILVKPGSIKTVQALGSGTVFSIHADIGEQVDAGEVMAVLNDPDQARQLNTDIARYHAKQIFNQDTLEISRNKRDLEIALVNTTIKSLNDETLAIEALRNKLKSQTRSNAREEADSLERNQQLLDELYRSQKKQLDAITELIEEGAASDSQRLQMQATLTDTESRISEMNLRKNSTQVRLLDTEQQDIRFLQELTQLNSRLQQELIKREKINQEFEIEEHRKSMELTELAANIRLTKERHFRLQSVHSNYTGRVLEVSSSVGENLGSGERLAIMQIESTKPFKRLVIGEDVSKGTFSLVYDGFTTHDIHFPPTAEKIQNALLALGIFDQENTVRVEPIRNLRVFDIYSTNNTEYFLEVNDEDLLTENNIPSFATVMNLGGVVKDEDLKHLCFFTIGDGKKVQKGMKIRMSPSNVERQRFGSIVGEAISVSAYPVTSEGVLSLTGNKDVAAALLEKGGTILVTAKLNKNPDNPEKYQWTSKGYDGEITAGTTTSCRVTVEERPPITFVVPLLRKWLMGESNNAPPV
ncbi:hypothetical protein [Curvivirga sp.]|uniref:hypothetical protein n=1 Tax=Curvivirga sp. TaxID=2856848 RepID=UPI003B590A81